MIPKYSTSGIPRFGPLIKDILEKDLANLRLGVALRKFDSDIVHFVSSKYLKSTRERAMAIGLDRDELVKLCNVSLRLFVVVEKFPLYETHLVENAVGKLRNDKSTLNVVRVFKKTFPRLKSEINWGMIYTWLIKVLIHQVLLGKELEKKARTISKSKKIPLWKIHDSLVGLDSVRYVQ